MTITQSTDAPRVFTRPTLPSRVRRVELSEYDRAHDAGDPGYDIESEIPEVTAHSIAEDDNGWEVWPGTHSAGFMTVSQMGVYMRELRMAVAAATTLNRHKPKLITPGNAALAEEVQARITEREWTTADAAEAFEMTEAKLTSRLRGHTSWTVQDLAAIANGLTDDADESWEIITQLGIVAFKGRNQDEAPSARDMWGDDEEPRHVEFSLLDAAELTEELRDFAASRGFDVDEGQLMNAVSRNTKRIRKPEEVAPADIARNIVSAAIGQFAEDNVIPVEHLTTRKNDITPVDIVRATRTLGTDGVFGSEVE